ncbi:CRISPR-associated endonuclease Cas1 [Luteithermobacter gelatinilyticus]|uniref:CRISPR-associated endonuclease Cas1 n=1 Tax=Luteithermobacter gelatinilyticus TaxID=2582913 RepID=UPI0011073584|nr:CRISPR-associated endonuclease Cas1 [Luteithermobacter gelatinilyticus]
MSSLYIDRRGITIRLESDALVFHDSGERIGTVPIAPLERIYLRGNVTLSSSLLGRLGRKGVGIVVLSGRKGDASLLLPRPHNDARLRVMQYETTRDPARALPLAQATVHAKLKAQANFLEQAAEQRPAKRHALITAAQTLKVMTGHAFRKSDLAALRGLEGAAAATYFSAYAHLIPPSANFRGRNRRPPRDPVNACLSLAYTLLHAEATLAAYGHGFDPYIGFLHDLDFGRESLACDLVEPLRPEMDRFVWRMFADQALRARDFSTEKGGACLMGKAARESFYNHVEQPLETVRKRLEETLKTLRRYILETTDHDDPVSDRL